MIFPTIIEAVAILVSDDYMIDDLNVQFSSHTGKPFLPANIFRRGTRVSSRVIVSDQDTLAIKA
jgi:hypothetical protein